ncbi:MAG: phosphatidylethanolamine/phosphatidyl-N-methylethanolamine N-methyltransferase [Methylobacteriaceae bacterium]|nr:phosphatidylethanolamine/phosphatidyl-N-methylethanolamine N-methyltransferase [Methylobacteriaceae bacterium]
MQSKQLRSERLRSPRLPLDERLADEARFFKRWLDNPKATGAVSPSGRFLARAMASYVDPAAHGPIIELGPGTGPVTEALIGRGVAAERLILVEYEPSFCKLLARRFPKARIVQGDAYRLAETLRPVLDEAAACVVSSLPLLTRPERGRLNLLRDSFELMQPDGAFIQFTYGLTSPVPLTSRMSGLRFRAEASHSVWLNLPPARVWVYRAGEAPISAAPRPTREDWLDRLKQRAREKGRELQLELEARLEPPHLRRVQRKRAPALALLRRLGDNGKGRR